MKKVTGKALSLVLSLALVISSFSASFASASTKTMTGMVDRTDNDKIYLVNGGNNLYSADLNPWIGASVFTNTRDTVESPKVTAISHVSGQSLVSLELKGSDDDQAYLKLKSNKVNGEEVIAVLFKGTYTDDNGNEYTVKAKKNITVYVYDKGQPVFGEVRDSGNTASHPEAGQGLDDFKTFAKTMNYTKNLGFYSAEPDMSKKTDEYGGAMATYAPIYLTKATSDISTTGTMANIAAKDSNAYSFEITSGKDYIHLTGIKDAVDPALVNEGVGSTDLKATVGSAWESNKYTKDASTGNVTFTLKKLVLASDGKSYKSSTDSADKYTFKTKIDKKVDVDQAKQNDSSFTGTSYSIIKNNGKSRIEKLIDKSSNSDNKYVDVTDCEVVFPKGTTKVSVDEKTNVGKISGHVGDLSIGDAHVGSVEIDGGNVSLADGKVGDITTKDDTNGNVLISSGSAGNIKTSDSDTGVVTVNGGTTGTIECSNTVTIDATNSDTPITTGVVTAKDVDIFSDEAKVTVGGLKAKADGTFTITGDQVTVKSIDMDSRTSSLQLGDDNNAFNGTVPAPTNATKATLKAVNDTTKATVTGDTKLDTIDLDSNTNVALTGSVTAKTVQGDGSLKVYAGKLYVSESVSSTKLKLADKTLTVGTTVFKADADTVDVEDFNCYGFTLSKSTGTSVDTFKIASLQFAGVAINKDSSEIVKGNSETFTASAYPSGTALPSGYTVQWSLDGGSSDVFDLTTNGNSATVSVKSIDDTFASENKTALTATLVDADGYVDENYEPATCDITAVATPAVQSDTTGNLNVAQGATYQFKLTSSDGSQPTFTVGNSAVFKVTPVGKSGNSYFFKITAVGKVGEAAGCYVNGTRVAVATITAPTLKLDTGSKLSVKAGNFYTVKITASSKPACTTGNSAVFKAVGFTQNGNNYFFKVQAVGKAGASTGLYVNGVRYIVATVA